MSRERHLTVRQVPERDAFEVKSTFGENTVEAICEATEAELVKAPYIAVDLGLEVLTACERFDGTVRTVPGDEAAPETADPS